MGTKTTILQVKHTRKVEQTDKYFMITVIDNHKEKLEVGYIEKNFYIAEFEKQHGLKVLSFREFKNKEDYDNEKYKQ